MNRIILIVGLLSTASIIKAQNLEQNLDSIMDGWHAAAAVAHGDLFFGLMKPDGIYIGTDASELWTADEMEVWAKEYFDKDSAWDFTAIERNWYYNSDSTVVWFDELLDTWMGVCRSSGVMEHETDWTLKHYHLSVAVPNEKNSRVYQVL